MSGFFGSAASVTVLNKLAPGPIVSNTAAITTLGTASIPANNLIVNNFYRWSAQFVVFNNTGSNQDITFTAVAIDPSASEGQIFLNIYSAVPTSAGGEPFIFDFLAQFFVRPDTDPGDPPGSVAWCGGITGTLNTRSGNPSTPTYFVQAETTGIYNLVAPFEPSLGIFQQGLAYELDYRFTFGTADPALGAQMLWSLIEVF